MNKATFILKILLLLCCYFNASAQVKWVQQINITNNNIERPTKIDSSYSFPRSTFEDGVAITALDFNNDGLKDIIFPTYYDQQIEYLRFFKNVGGGQFSEITNEFKNSRTKGKYLIFANDHNPVKIDFNKDGKTDFLFAGTMENVDTKNYDSIFGFQKNIDYFYKTNPSNLDLEAQGKNNINFYYQDSGKIKDGHDLFDKQLFGRWVGGSSVDMDNDGYEDLIVLGQGFVANDSTINDFVDGMAIMQNQSGKSFKFSKFDFIDTVNKLYFRPMGGNVCIADYNNDGFKDILIYGQSVNYLSSYSPNGIDSSKWSENYRKYLKNTLKFETRLYINNKGVFDATNFKVLTNIRADQTYTIDLNADGLIDFISMWRNISYGSKVNNYNNQFTAYEDSLTNKDGVNVQYYVCINKGGFEFEDQTKKYFPYDSTKFSRIATGELRLVDLNNDGFLDLLPGTGGGADTLYNSYGNFAQDTAGSMSSIFYKNYSNKYFKKEMLDTFYISKSWRNYPESKNIDSLWKNSSITTDSQNYPPNTVKGNYLFDNYTYLNYLYPDDFNNDGKIDLFAYRVGGVPPTLFNALQKKYGLYESYSGLNLIFQCNPPKPIFNTTKYSFCSGDSLKLTVTNINKGDTLKWYYGTKTDLTNVSNKTFTDSTKLFVTRTDSLGCIISSDTVQLIKASIPSTPTIAWNGTQFTATSTSTGINYQWFLSNSAISGATSANYKPTAIGSYKIQITDANTCKNVSDSFMLVVTAVDPSIETSIDHIAKILPNPASTNVMLYFQQKPNKTLTIQLLNLKGQVLKQTTTNSQSARISLSEIIAGNYIIQIIGKGYNQTQQLLITQ